MHSLNRADAFKFLENVLKIRNAPEKLEIDRLKFLQETVRAHYRYIPFQNFTLYGKCPPSQTLPTTSDCISNMLSGTGGVCLSLNGGFKLLLEALDFKVSFINANILLAQIRDCHIGLMVSDIVEPGDSYLVDVGFGYPTFEAVPLQGKDCHFPRIYTFAFHWCKFVKDENGLYVRYHLKKDIMGEMIAGIGIEKTTLPNEAWEPFIIYEAVRRPLSYFNEPMTKIYMDPSVSIFLNLIFAAVYPDGKAITLKDLTLRVWDEEADEVVEKITFESVDEACEVIPNYLDCVDRSDIIKAYRKWEIKPVQKQIAA